MIRRFETSDAKKTLQLFRDCVHRVAKKDYSDAQLSAWAPDEIDLASWTERLSASLTFVSVADEVLIGFASLTLSGEVDMFYVHADFQNRGVGKALLDVIELRAHELGLSRLTSDVSKTARPFFTRSGFRVERENAKTVRGVQFFNVIMSKALDTPHGSDPNC